MGNMHKSFLMKNISFTSQMIEFSLVFYSLYTYFNLGLATNIAKQSYFYCLKQFTYYFMDFSKTGNSSKGFAFLL